MSQVNRFTLCAISIATLQACSSLPADNPALNRASQDMARAQANAEVERLAPHELEQAKLAMDTTNTAWSSRATPAEVDHLAYLAKQSVAIAVETTRRKKAELDIANADDARTRMLLSARSEESIQAKLDAQTSKAQAQDFAAEASAANERTRQAQDYAAVLKARLVEINARETARGFIVTLGDIHFDNNRATLKAVASDGVMRLGDFLRLYPQRTILAEGYTDDVGSAESNVGLSSRRADSVRTALIGMGIDGRRISSRGYGELYPIGTNTTPEGRELNRRVEIILSDEKGVLIGR